MKRFSARQYAVAVDQALHAAKGKDVSLVADRLMTRLRHDRAMRFLPRILYQLRQLDATRHGRRLGLIEAASGSWGLSLAKKLPDVDARVEIDQMLQRGLAVTIDDRRIDASLQGRLKQLLASLTSDR